MPLPESESSLPHSGGQQQQPPRSSPPSFGQGASFGAMDDGSPPRRPDSADLNPAEAAPPEIIRANSNETERPSSAQRPKADAREMPDPDDEAALDDDPDLFQKIDDFDWDELHERYHRTVNNASEAEAGLMREWANLMEFFKIWAEAGHSHETDRTFKRLRTRMAYTQHAEENLERTRDHYTKVVQAFESALELLKNSGFPR